MTNAGTRGTMSDEQKPEVKPKNLVQKLCEVMSAVERVEKRGRNEFHKYDYAREADIVEAIRGELASRNLFIFPSVETHTRTAEITDIMVAWCFVDGDSGEERVCRIPGSGQDKGDKGVYKALTGSEKYFLMKAFLIPTGDDPEADSKEDKKAAKETGRAAAQAVAQRKIAEAKGGIDQRRIVTVSKPEAFNGHYFAAEGKLDEERMREFLLDVNAAHLKRKSDGLPYWRIPAEYEKAFLELAAKLELEVKESA